MNPDKTVVRLLILSQIFMLFCLILLPAIIRLLPGLLGQVLYGLMVLTAIGLAIALRYALTALR